jgi:hypothetical protein
MRTKQRTLVIVFGGADYSRIKSYNCTSFYQAEFGLTNVSDFQPREPSIILASLITGELQSVHGINREYIIENKLIRRIYEFMRSRSETTRQTAGSLVDVKKRRPIKSDFHIDTIFDQIDGSIPVSIPSYNPETAWCVDRNVISPLEYPELGLDAAEDLLEKNFEWRKKRCLEAIDSDSPFVMCHFQKIDSVQHLYYKYSDDEDRIKQVYHEMDELAADIRDRAQKSGFDRIDFISEHGLPRDDSLKHEDTGFYSSNQSLGLDTPSITEFYDTYIQ